MPSEMASSKNFGVRKREAIGIVKSMVEVECPRQVSCADLLILAAREAVAMSGGPWIRVPLGRRDSVTTSYELADASLPPSNTGVDGMLHILGEKGMTVEESEGEHAAEMDPGFEAFLKLSCPQGSLTSNSSFVGNDLTDFVFDNQYYRDTMGGRGVLKIDAYMAMDPRTAPIMAHFANNKDDFYQAFISAFVKLSSTGVLTGNQGVVRKSCNAID
ncbi:hypothetical protein HHK36_012240 [Tetracentron sinense]|uniref:Plant heme peroxidase family profile domain-containing protein n=1 Tax=Tetracentron sinense TaxID=13715 RepID=A0A834Z874_TETSI|nr:hypothetical protein HHK36_012240 [Tetracentron sinense]